MSSFQPTKNEESMKTILNLTLKSMFLLAVILMIITGCKKNDNPAPALPPQSSFVMDFSDFSNPNDTLVPREINTYQNWGFSYANVVVWQSLITVGLAVPVASFAESFNHEAVYHPNADNWTWSYNVTVGMVVYEAKLTGYLQSDSVVWEMRVTKGTDFADFLWYYGKSALNETGGYWILQENPLNPNPLLKIDWNHYDVGMADITYTNIRPEDPQNGGYIFYGTNLNDFNRFYHVYNKGLDNLTEIEWNSINKNGHVKDLHHFGDEQWHCWNELLIDISCQ
jgi:hypothetical protein